MAPSRTCHRNVTQICKRPGLMWIGCNALKSAYSGLCQRAEPGHLKLQKQARMTGKWTALVHRQQQSPAPLPASGWPGALTGLAAGLSLA